MSMPVPAGALSPVLAPEMLAVGVAFPLAPGAYSVTELAPVLATNVVPGVGGSAEF
jgi:hypothetical protein